MIKYRYYDKEKRRDYAWYESSNIVYSECDDHENDYKTLRIVFKNGATYEYKDVNVNDYVMFMHGGLDGSNGKAFFKFIKPKYICERLTNTDLEDLNQLMREKKMISKEEQHKEDEAKKEKEMEKPN